MSKSNKLKPDSMQKSISDYLVDQTEANSDCKYSTPIAQPFKRKKPVNSPSPNDKSSPLLKKPTQRMEQTNLASTSTNTVSNEEDAKLNEMEERLNRNLTKNISKNLEGYINDSIKGALDNMTSAIEKLAETNQNLINQNSEIKHLKDENIKLTSKVVHLQHEQEKINRKLKTIESNVISCSIIM